MIVTKDGFQISDEKSRLNLDYIHAFLSHSYWAEEIPMGIVKKSIAGAMCFGVYTEEQQVGFARVITDKATFAYLADVFIDDRWRGKGLSKWLMTVIMDHPDLQGLRRFMLATRDAHGLYTQFGFEPISNPERLMAIARQDMYKKRGV